MTEPPVNTDDDYYGNEAFEEDSPSSEVEEEPEHEDAVGQHYKTAATAYESDSDSLTESDVEAEFLKGNVSAAANVQELKIAEFSLSSNDSKPNKPAYTYSQPYARRQHGGRVQGAGGFNQKRMHDYPSSSEDDENNVVVTQTVAEVNHSALHGEDEEEEPSSVRTLKPSNQQQHEYIDDEIEEDNEELEYEHEDDDDVVLSDGNEDGSFSLDEEALEEAEIVDEELLEEQSDDASGIVDAQQRDLAEPAMDTVYVEDASDSEENVIGVAEPRTPRRLAHTDDVDTDITLTPRGRRQQQKRFRMRAQATSSHRQLRSKLALEMQMLPIPEANYTFDIRDSDKPPTPKMDAFLDNMQDSVETFSTRSKDAHKADTAAVKFLEQQMAQMSEMIMKSFRISGGAREHQKHMPPSVAELSDAMDEDTPSSDQLQSMTEPSSSAREQSSAESLPTVRPVQLARPPCRCPSTTELDESYYMDECGQGDGLMRYSEEHFQQQQLYEHQQQLHEQQQHQHLIPELNVRMSSMTPSSLNSEPCKYQIELKRPRSSTDKVNYKNLGRKSFSFTNAQVREIERQNHILLKKMMTIKPTISGKPTDFHQLPKKQLPPVTTRTTNAAVNRKKFQRQVELDNDVLKRKLQAIGSRRPIFK